MREPFNLSAAEIADLTDWQIANVLFGPHPADQRPGSGADDWDNPHITHRGVQQSDREICEGVWRAQGCDPQEIERRWQCWLRDEPFE